MNSRLKKFAHGIALSMSLIFSPINSQAYLNDSFNKSEIKEIENVISTPVIATVIDTPLLSAKIIPTFGSGNQTQTTTSTSPEKFKLQLDYPFTTQYITLENNTIDKYYLFVASQKEKTSNSEIGRIVLKSPLSLPFDLSYLRNSRISLEDQTKLVTERLRISGKINSWVYSGSVERDLTQILFGFGNGEVHTKDTYSKRDVEFLTKGYYDIRDLIENYKGLFLRQTNSNVSGENLSITDVLFNWSFSEVPLKISGNALDIGNDKTRSYQLKLGKKDDSLTFETSYSPRKEYEPEQSKIGIGFNYRF